MRRTLREDQQSQGGPPRLTDPLTNKGTAFTADERRQWHLDGWLPPRVESLEEQTARVVANLREKADPLERYRYLRAVQDENETLFYRVALDHLEETLPIIYTPTVGQACTAWSRLYDPEVCISRQLFVGAGEACLGIGLVVIAAMQREGSSEDEARGRVCSSIPRDQSSPAEPTLRNRNGTSLNGVTRSSPW